MGTVRTRVGLRVDRHHGTGLEAAVGIQPALDDHQVACRQRLADVQLAQRRRAVQQFHVQVDRPDVRRRADDGRAHVPAREAYRAQHDRRPLPQLPVVVVGPDVRGTVARHSREIRLHVHQVGGHVDLAVPEVRAVVDAEAVSQTLEVGADAPEHARVHVQDQRRGVVRHVQVCVEVLALVLADQHPLAGRENAGAVRLHRRRRQGVLLQFGVLRLLVVRQDDGTISGKVRHPEVLVVRRHQTDVVFTPPRVDDLRDAVRTVSRLPEVVERQVHVMRLVHEDPLQVVFQREAERQVLLPAELQVHLLVLVRDKVERVRQGDLFRAVHAVLVDQAAAARQEQRPRQAGHGRDDGQRPPQNHSEKVSFHE